jgi:hypothetical protein
MSGKLSVKDSFLLSSDSFHVPGSTGVTISPCAAVYLTSPEIAETIPSSVKLHLMTRGNLAPDFAQEEGMVENGSLPISRATLQHPD